MEWYWFLVIVVLGVGVWLFMSCVFYKSFFKRFYDIFLSFISIVVFSPLILFLVIFGSINMKGNPFFFQERTGKDGKVFKLIKFRSMTCERDPLGNLLPDGKRMTKYGLFIRKTSLDELPELLNIFVGHMSVVGPRPLLVKYLSRYNNEQKHRLDVKPGLTGYAQVNGRNLISWEEKFKLDLFYIQHCTFFGDIIIIIKTFFVVIKKSGVNAQNDSTMEEFEGEK